MNSQLYNRKAKLPDSLVKHLEKSFNSMGSDTNVEGHNRNKELRETGVATYQQIKRIKNWFDSYNGNKEDAPFILNGGDRMNTWCDEVLNVWRNSTEGGKEIKKDTGMMNQYNDEHTRDNLNIADTHSSTVDNLKIESIKEDIKRINKLIKNTNYAGTKR
jgi:hypothetical protein